ncbi:DUF420 domain-containing protein [Tuwongella immobilis]|uniref:DUF420 domain-containing protein n=1 Tax=Tuwongella immobilis TaxID=692036 RepID=A0A6C2YXC8_9BACT|nr:DUF420 domain-containing protein [Tuwongella immobilis]VIP05472.1 unnamed protein product [Tuwongella immobilis]VTS08300.1 unnamed protein product [Tuwongella immobilis]
MFTAPNVIMGLKIAVSAVTVLLIASVIAIILGRKRLHGRINLAFFVLTMVAVIFFEVIIRLINPQLTASFTPEQRQALNLHLCFSIPSAILMPFMLYSGMTHRRFHVPLAVVFSLVWLGTFITGVFTLPHTAP